MNEQMETLTCQQCGQAFTRKRKRGRKPRKCQVCSGTNREKAFSPAPVKNEVSANRLPTHDVVMSWVHLACVSNGVPHLANTITYQWKDNLRITAGKAYPKQNRFTLSRPLFGRISKDDQRNTVIHEVCHLLDWELNRKCDHGTTFYTLMQNAGETPSTYHNYNIEGLRNKVKRVESVCRNCGKKHLLTQHKAKQVYRYHCRKCGSVTGKIQLTGKIVEIQ